MIFGCSEDTSNSESISEDSSLEKALDQSLIRGERIDGPANIRDGINGKILMSLSDNVLVDCGKLTDNWFHLSLTIPLTSQQLEAGFIKKETSIYDEEAQLILEAKQDLELIMINRFEGEEFGMLEGYTHVNNIKPNSIAEKELEKILNSGEELSISNFLEFIKQFEFRNEGLIINGYETLNQYMIFGAWIEDPSPVDRIRLMFKDDQLFSIIHERDISMIGKVSYPISHGLNIMVIPDIDDKELKEFIELNNESYKGVD